MKKRVLIVVESPGPGSLDHALRGGVRRSSPERRESWLQRAREQGRAA